MTHQPATAQAVGQRRIIRRSGEEYEPWLEHPSEARKQAYADAGVRTLQRDTTLYVHVWDTEEAVAIDAASAI